MWQKMLGLLLWEIVKNPTVICPLSDAIWTIFVTWIWRRLLGTWKLNPQPSLYKDGTLLILIMLLSSVPYSYFYVTWVSKRKNIWFSKFHGTYEDLLKVVEQLFGIEMFTLSQRDRDFYSYLSQASTKTNKQSIRWKKNAPSENILPKVLPYQPSLAALFVGTQPS